MECKHYFHWVHENGVWTDYRKCDACGLVELCVREKGLKEKYRQEDASEPWRDDGFKTSSDEGQGNPYHNTDGE